MSQLEGPMGIEKICRKLKPILGSKVDNLYLQYATAETIEEKKEIESILKALYNKKLDELLSKDVLLEPPQEEQVSGDVTIGKVSYANKELHDFALRECDLPRHVCISGMSGSGKTTLAFNIIEQFILIDKPFMVFDWKKSFRPLMNKGDDVMIFPIGNEVVGNYFKININQPPKNIPPKEWITVLADLISESFLVSYGVHKVLVEALDHAYEVNGVYDGSENYPTWKQIKDYLDYKAEKSKGRESRWLESALRIATVLTFGSFGKILNAKKSKGMEIGNLLNKKIIFELNSLGNVEKKFFCEFVLTYIFKMKKSYDNLGSNSFDHAIVVDEAHNIFLKDRPNFLRESVTDAIYREMREYGTSLICLDQHISKLSDTVKGNSACHIAFQQQLPQDISDISELMQMRYDKETFSQLSVGSAIVKLSDRYIKPFLVKIPFEERRELITDMELADRIQAIVTGKLSTKPSLVEEILEMKEFSEPILKPIELPKLMLTKSQEVLFDYVKDKMAQGTELKEINTIMESHKDRNLYTNTDISKVINLALDRYMAKLNGKQVVKVEDVVSSPRADINANVELDLTKEEVKKAIEKRRDETKKVVDLQNPIKKIENLSKDQEKFLRFVVDNHDHELSTVDLYKTVGLSARKGNVVKNQLLERKLIKIQEEKNDKGWKKLIRSNLESYSQIKNNKQSFE